jgi:serine O-acetyltransferase
MPDGLAGLIAADARRYRLYVAGRFGFVPFTYMLDPGMVCVTLHRISHSLFSIGWRKLGWWVKQANSMITGADIEPGCKFGPGLLIPHPVGVTLSTRSGRDLTVFARAGCGGSVQSGDVGAGPGLPVLGNGVRLGDFCGQQGGIYLGDGAVVESGAGALVDIPAGGRGVLASEPICDTQAPSAEAKPTRVPTCAHHCWSDVWRDWNADVERFCGELERYDSRRVTGLRRIVAALSNSLIALLVYRTSHWLHLAGHRRSARFASSFNLLIHKLAITPETCLGGGVLMPHLSGLLVDGLAGKNATIYANCVIARLGDQRPIAGNGLALGGHAGLIGAVRAGDDVRLAPKVQLTSDAPAGAQAYSPMSRVKRLGPGEHRPQPPHACLPEPPADAWTHYHECRKADRERLLTLYPDAMFSGRWAVALYRLSSAMLASGHPRTAHLLWRTNMYLTGCDFAPDSEIGPGLVAPYPAGVSLFATAGRNLTLHAQAMAVAEVDSPGERSRTQAPLIGNNVTLEPHSAICGPTRIGDHVTVRPGCVVRFAVDNGQVVRPKPLKLRISPVAAAEPKR